MNKKTQEIKDSYFVTYGIFYSMGVLTFVPHQFFVTSTEYWMFKFRDPFRDIPGPSKWPPYDPYRVDEMGFAHGRTPLQANFTSSFSITCQISKLGFLVFTAIFSKRLPPPQKRILGALLSTLVLFLINTSFTKINTDSFQEAFYAITMILAILLNVSSAVTLISLFELAAKFPLGYFAAILSGQAICGIFSSIVQILTLNCRNPPLGGFIYFGVGTLITIFTTVFYLITKKKSKYFIYRISQCQGTNNEIQDDRWCVNLLKMKEAMQKTKWFLGSLVFVQGSTTLIHPGLAALVVSEDDDSGLGGEWAEVYFVPVITFFCFHLADFIGRESARKIKRPRNAVVILTLAILRLGLIPIIMLCNAQPRRKLPVYFGDNVYIFIIILIGYTQGFLVSSCIISIPRVVRKEELEYAAMLVPLFSMITVAICSAFNMLIISLI